MPLTSNLAHLRAYCSGILRNPFHQRHEANRLQLRVFKAFFQFFDFDQVLIKKMQSYNRGRSDDETATLLDETFRQMGYTSDQLQHAITEVGAVRDALSWAEPGDLVLCLAHEDRDGVRDLLEAQAAAQRGH